MKKNFLSLIVLLTMYFPNFIFAQTELRTSAWNWLKDGTLDKAKDAIDKVCINESTKDDAKTWYFRGLIYANISVSDKDEYKKLCDNCLQEAYDAIKKSIDMDKKELYLDDNKNVLKQTISAAFFNKGVALYNKAILENSNANTQKESIETFKLALKSFDTFWEILDKLGNDANYVISFLEKNNIKLNNIRLFTGYCAKMAGDKEKAKAQFGKIINVKADDNTAKMNTEPVYYIQYAYLLNDMGYFFDAIEVIEKGRTLWPENRDLTITELDIYQKAGKTDELSNKLKEAIDLEPTNLNLLSSYASTLGNMIDNFDKNNDTINSKLYQQKAITAYLKAIDMTFKYKNEVKYKVTGTSNTYDISYVNENNEKKKETAVSGWEYSFNAKEGTVVSLNASAKDKKTTTIVTIYLAGSAYREAQNSSGKNYAGADGTITKEELEKTNNLGDLYYNLGLLYFNPGVEAYNKSINENDQTKYKELEKQYLSLFDNAAPWLEKSHQERPTDKLTLQTLQKLYLVTKKNDKALQINQELKNLGKQTPNKK